MTNETPRRKRVPSETIFLPPMKVVWAVTDPNRPENKFDPEKKRWSLRLVSTSEENRKEVEMLLGPYGPRFLEIKREELIAEAEGNKIKLKRLESGDQKVGPLDYEVAWRERIDRETAEPTGELEIELKRDEYRTDRNGTRVRNAPPIVLDADLNQIDIVPRSGSIVVAKMATWPVYFPQDNKVGMKKLLEGIQVISVPAARAPDASGFKKVADGYTSKGAAEGSDEDQAGGPVSSGADY